MHHRTLSERWRRQYKASLCVWRMQAELMGLETQMCHKSLSTQNWIVLLFTFTGLVGEVGLLNVTRLLYIIRHILVKTEGRLLRAWANMSIKHINTAYHPVICHICFLLICSKINAGSQIRFCIQATVSQLLKKTRLLLKLSPKVLKQCTICKQT